MSDTPAIVVGIAGAVLAAGAGLTGGVIVARGAARTAKGERLRELYKPPMTLFMAINASLGVVPNWLDDNMRATWARHHAEDVANFANLSKSSWAVIGFDPDTKGILPLIADTQAAGQACTTRLDQMDMIRNPSADPEFARLRDIFNAKLDVLVDAITVQLRDLDASRGAHSWEAQPTFRFLLPDPSRW